VGHGSGSSSSASVPGAVGGADPPLQLRPMMVLDFAATFGVGVGGVTSLGQLRDTQATADTDRDVAGAAAEADTPERAWRRQVLQHSPAFAGSTVCVGFGDGAVLVFREATRSFSARLLTSPDSFRCLGILVNPDPAWATDTTTNRAVTSLSVARGPASVDQSSSTTTTADGSSTTTSSGGNSGGNSASDNDGPLRVLVTYAGYPRAVEFTLPPGAAPWEADAVSNPSTLPRVGCVCPSPSPRPTPWLVACVGHL
jgi:hypothetical protein